MLKWTRLDEEQNDFGELEVSRFLFATSGVDGKSISLGNDKIHEVLTLFERSSAKFERFGVWVGTGGDTPSGFGGAENHVLAGHSGEVLSLVMFCLAIEDTPCWMNLLLAKHLEKC